MDGLSSHWVKYRWDLRGVDFRLSAPDGYRDGGAKTADIVRILDVVIEAYGSDPL